MCCSGGDSSMSVRDWTSMRARRQPHRVNRPVVFPRDAPVAGVWRLQSDRGHQLPPRNIHREPDRPAVRGSFWRAVQAAVAGGDTLGRFTDRDFAYIKLKTRVLASHYAGPLGTSTV